MDNTICFKIHELINNLPVYNYKNIDKIPFDNGIYFVFEDGEKYHDFNRIVRVGINISQGNLKDRLKSHYKNKNHGSSVFIKHIGGVFLNIANDNYLEIWYKKDSPKIQIDSYKENYYENKASQYIQNNTSVSVIEVKDYEIRKRLEGAIISTLNNTDDFKQSSNWFGNNSPKDKIKNSGMWVVHGLNNNILSTSEFELLINLIEQSTIYTKRLLI